MNTAHILINALSLPVPTHLTRLQQLRDIGRLNEADLAIVRDWLLQNTAFAANLCHLATGRIYAVGTDGSPNVRALISSCKRFAENCTTDLYSAPAQLPPPPAEIHI